MSKKVFVLVHDYWHHDDSIKPMMNYLFNADYDYNFRQLPHPWTVPHNEPAWND